MPIKFTLNIVINIQFGNPNTMETELTFWKWPVEGIGPARGHIFKNNNFLISNSRAKIYPN